MSSTFLASAAVASITAALFAMPAQAAPFGTTPGAVTTEATSLVTTVSGHRGDQHNRFVRQNHRSEYSLRQDRHSGYVARPNHRWGYFVPEIHRRGNVEQHGNQRRHGR